MRRKCTVNGEVTEKHKNIQIILRNKDIFRREIQHGKKCVYSDSR